MQTIEAIDTYWFLFINGLHDEVLDFLMYWASDKFIWIGLYVFLLFLIYKHHKKRTVLIFLLAIALVTISDQLTSGIIKNMVKRPRPSHEAALVDKIHLVKDYHGGLYGFPSSHTSNSFALAVFIFLLLEKKYRWIKFVLFPYAILVSYSRIYLGVHYPLDVFCGMLIGCWLGITTYIVWDFFYKRMVAVQK